MRRLAALWLLLCGTVCPLRGEVTHYAPPPGVPDAQFQWLEAVRAADTDAKRQVILDQHPEWCTPTSLAVLLRAPEPIGSRAVLPWLSIRSGLLTLADRIGDPVLRARVAFRLGFAERWREDPDGAVVLFSQALTSLTDGKTPVPGWGRAGPKERAQTLMAQTDLDAVRARLSASGDSHGLAEFERTLAGLLTDAGKTEEAVAAFEQAQRLYEACGDRGGALVCRAEALEPFARISALDEPVKDLTANVAEMEARGDAVGAAELRQTIGYVMIRNRRYVLAASFAGKAAAVFERLGDATRHAECLITQGEAERLSQHDAEALETLTTAEKLCEAAGDRLGLARATLLRAWTLYSAYRYDEAITAAQAASTLFAKLDQPWSVAECDATIARALLRSNRRDAGLPLTDRCIETYVRAGLDLVAAKQIEGFGTALTMGGDYLGAAMMYRKAMALYASRHRMRDVGCCYRRIAEQYGFAGQVSAMLEARELAVEIQAIYGTTVEQAGAYADMGRFLIDHGCMLEARAQLEKAMALLAIEQPTAEAAEPYLALCHYFLALGDHDRASEALSRARAMIALSESPIFAADRQLKIAEYETDLGLIGQAITDATHSLQTFRRLKYPFGQSLAYTTLGRLNWDEGHVADALWDLQQARAVYERAGDVARLVDTLRSIADYFRDLGAFDQAEAALRELGQMAKRAQTADMGIHDLSLGSLLRYEGRLDEALATFERARQSYMLVGDEWDTAYCNQVSGETCLAAGRPEEALRFLTSARQFFERRPAEDTTLWCDIGIGEALVQLHRYPEALAVAQSADRIDGKWSKGAAAVAGRSFRIGCIYEATGHRADAQEHYGEALRQWEGVRGESSDPAFRTLSSQGLRHLPGRLAALKLQAGDTAAAFSIAERGKGAVIRDALLGGRNPSHGLPDAEARRLRELHAAYDRAESQASNADTASARQERDQALQRLNDFELALRGKYPRWAAPSAPSASTSEITKILDGHSAVLEILVSEDHLCLLVLRKNGNRTILTGSSQPVPEAILRKLVEGFRDELSALKGDAGRIRQLSRRLYAHLIAPVESQLTGVDTLIVCPDDFLHGVPFPALQDGTGRYLIQRFAIATAPSASAWQACRTVHAMRGNTGKEPPLIAAVSRFGSHPTLVASTAPRSARRGKALADLPGVRREVQVVAHRLPRAVVLLDKAATVASVEKEAPKAGLLHFATHAFANDAAPLRSALVFSPDKGEGFGLLYANDIYDLPLRADLAVLSACATARGQATGEGLMGLAWAFLVAGCPSTIGTRWDADDAASEAWVTAFYTHYATAKATKAQSVRAACLHLLTTRKYAAPHNWANWTLIGSDR